MNLTITTPSKTFSMVVREMSTLDHMHARRYRTDRITNPHKDEDAQILLVFFYSVLSHAVSGDVPNEEEFLALSAQNSDAWYSAVDKLNPGVLPKPEDEVEKTPEEVEAELVKKDQTPT